MNDLTQEYQEPTRLIFNPEKMNQLYKFAEAMASCKVSVPKHLAGSVGDCLAIVLQAQRWNMDEFSVAQQCFLVNGQIGYSAQLINAVISSSRAIKGRFHYEHEGDWAVTTKPETRNGKTVFKFIIPDSARTRAGAVINGEEEITWGEWMYPALQKVKNSPLWGSNPRQQSSYLVVKMWARIYTPDVIMGVYDKDELNNTTEQVRSNQAKDVTPAKSSVDTLLSSAEPEVENVVVVEEEKPKKHDAKAMASYKDSMTACESIKDLRPILVSAYEGTDCEKQKAILKKTYEDVKSLIDF